MKLTYTTTANKRRESREVEYDMKPECRLIPTEEYKHQGCVKFGVHVIWAYFNGGKRVAIVVVNRGNNEIKPCEANRLRRCWPERIFIGAITTFGGTTQTPGKTRKFAPRMNDRVGGAAWLTADGRPQRKPLALNPYFSDEVFIHPADDETYDATIHLTTEDRDWIEATDRRKREEARAKDERQRQVESARDRNGEPPVIVDKAIVKAVVEETLAQQQKPNAEAAAATTAPTTPPVEPTSAKEVEVENVLSKYSNHGWRNTATPRRSVPPSDAAMERPVWRSVRGVALRSDQHLL